MDSNWVFFRAKNSRGGVKLEFVRNSFDSKIDNSVDSKRQKKFKKFDNFWFEIRSIRKKIIRKILKFFKFSILIRKIWQNLFLTIFWTTICNLQHYFNCVLIPFLKKRGPNDMFSQKCLKTFLFIFTLLKKIVGKNSKKFQRIGNNSKNY